LNRKERELLYAQGWQPYSIKINNKYYSYNRLDPLGMVIGMTADFVNAIREFPEQETRTEGASKIVLAMTRNLISKTYMSSLSSFAEAFSEPERYGERFIERMAGSLIPSNVGTVARAIDPYMKDIETPGEAILARIPFLSRQVPYKVGAYGLPAERPSGIHTIFSPISISEETGFSTIAEIDRLTYKLEAKLRKQEKTLLKEALRQTRKY